MSLAHEDSCHGEAVVWSDRRRRWVQPGLTPAHRMREKVDIATGSTHPYRRPKETQLMAMGDKRSSRCATREVANVTVRIPYH